MLDISLDKKLIDYRQSSLYRQRRILSASQATQVYYQEQSIISFASNDYLGLCTHPQVIKAFQDAAEKYGVGSGASQLITGHRAAHQELEHAFAEFLQRESALLFSNGYMANLGVMTALAQAGDSIYQDKLNHASLIDAGLLAKAQVKRYPHNNLQQLISYLSKQTQGEKLIVTDSVFSMRGDIACIPELVEIAKLHQASLMVDDAHGIGVLGKTGRGVLEHFNLKSEDIPILVCPLGKAFGGFGALVSGSKILIEYLIQFARSYIYTTAIPPALACAAQASLRLIQTETWRREKLFHLIRHFKTRAQEVGLNLLPSETPIQALILGDPQLALSLSEQLLAQGFLVFPIRPPTAPKQLSGLRITLSCMHEEMHINQLIDHLANINGHLF